MDYKDVTKGQLCICGNFVAFCCVLLVEPLIGRSFPVTFREWWLKAEGSEVFGSPLRLSQEWGPGQQPRPPEIV